MATSFRAKSVLLLDADRRSSQRLAGLLEEDGFRVEVLNDGASAMARLRLEPVPDALITEVNLPIIDGASVARFAASRAPNMQLIVLTRYPNLVAPQVLGMRTPAVLSKPLDYASLLALLAGRSASVAPRSRSSAPGRS